MISGDYEPLFKNILPSYGKGYLIDDFEIDEQKLKNLFKHIIDKNIKFKCDLIKFIFNIVKSKIIC